MTFVESGFVSVVAKTPSGHSLEVGIIDREGMVGVPVILGQFRSPHESYAQVAGHGYQMSAEVSWTAMRQDWRKLEEIAGGCYGVPESELAHVGLN